MLGVYIVSATGQWQPIFVNNVLKRKENHCPSQQGKLVWSAAIILNEWPTAQKHMLLRQKQTCPSTRIAPVICQHFTNMPVPSLPNLCMQKSITGPESSRRKLFALLMNWRNIYLLFVGDGLSSMNKNGQLFLCTLFSWIIGAQMRGHVRSMMGHVVVGDVRVEVRTGCWPVPRRRSE